MKLLIKTQALSWKKRRALVAGEWADIGREVDMAQFRLREEQFVEVLNRLDGTKVIEKVYE